MATALRPAHDETVDAGVERVDGFGARPHLGDDDGPASCAASR